MKKQGFYWHVHHDALLEYCYDYGKRVKAIKKTKPKHEIKTRLRLLKPVKAKLPDDLVRVGLKYRKACQECDKALQKCDKARLEYDKTLQEYDKAWQKYYNAKLEYYKVIQKYDKAWQEYYKCLSSHKTFLEELHKKECNCREWNGIKIVF